jgi:DNA-binding LytR/AlgR family response regulator|tara:strand:+ start:345 stop:1109 length:765 start_codon:yes stop_codon:yes gene_type:complete
MNVIIVEDEKSAIKNMIAMLHEIDPTISVIASIQTISEATKWITNNPPPELAFFDIQLADGHSFEIFKKTTVKFPIIFTTAYNEFALRAFKVNSIDYLLKPIKKKELVFAINKFKKINEDLILKNKNFIATMKTLNIEIKKSYKKTILVKMFDGLIPIQTSSIAYFFIENGIVYGYSYDKVKFVINETLDQLEGQLSSSDFFRANRQYIVSRNSIKKAQNYFNKGYSLKLNPSKKEIILISKAKVSLFKNWLGQ